MASPRKYLRLYLVNEVNRGSACGWNWKRRVAKVIPIASPDKSVCCNPIYQSKLFENKLGEILTLFTEDQNGTMVL